jgi:hypothetical protein
MKAGANSLMAAILLIIIQNYNNLLYIFFVKNSFKNFLLARFLPTKISGALPQISPFEKLFSTTRQRAA